ncbi:hypothetical protein M9194_18375 [Vibrio sp. S4M6]|uniref:hypothetical protein n=1 Tax=Vibrio sinus TaxID=2946865 RepID=UPI00202A3158|nr:hypothetical protein [Vibrio sinus]MCL9783399.1 hypothetical protein [Vibrio sinus]
MNPVLVLPESFFYVQAETSRNSYIERAKSLIIDSLNVELIERLSQAVLWRLIDEQCFIGIKKYNIIEKRLMRKPHTITVTDIFITRNTINPTILLIPKLLQDAGFRAM